MIKCAQVFKAAFQRNVNNVVVGGRQHGRRVLDPDIVEINAQRNTGGRLKQPADILPAFAGRGDDRAGFFAEYLPAGQRLIKSHEPRRRILLKVRL